MFFLVVFPVLRPVIVTAVIVTSIAVFNDFTNPLYFLPGDKNATLQLTLFNFQSQYNTEWNLLAMDVLLITIPPLIAFLFFSRQIVAGMAAGAVKCVMATSTAGNWSRGTTRCSTRRTRPTSSPSATGTWR